MTPVPSEAQGASELARRHLRRRILQIFAVQIVTMLGLWLLSAVYGVS